LLLALSATPKAIAATTTTTPTETVALTRSDRRWNLRHQRINRFVPLLAIRPSVAVPETADAVAGYDSPS
jgi:hypothetical protein